jgi:hypothetical protein
VYAVLEQAEDPAQGNAADHEDNEPKCRGVGKPEHKNDTFETKNETVHQSGGERLSISMQTAPPLRISRVFAFPFHCDL